MSTESLPSKPPVEAYSDEEFQVVVDHIHKVGWKVDDFEERAEKRIDRKGRGPHCPECEMKPAGVKERSVHGDWGRCSTTGVSGVNTSSRACAGTCTRTTTSNDAVLFSLVAAPVDHCPHRTV